MKRLWKYGIPALLLACVVSEVKAIVNAKPCLEAVNVEGRLVCQLIDTGMIVERSICFSCIPKPTADDLKGLCKEIYPEKCTPYSRCGSNFLESCKRSCVGAAIQKTCETLCEEQYKTRCKPGSGCKEIIMDNCPL